jgi:hypothetical protein
VEIGVKRQFEAKYPELAQQIKAEMRPQNDMKDQSLHHKFQREDQPKPFKGDQIDFDEQQLTQQQNPQERPLEQQSPTTHEKQYKDVVKALQKERDLDLDLEL